MSTTIRDVLEGLTDDEIIAHFLWSWKRRDGWEDVDEEILSYDEGNVHQSVTLKDNNTGRYFTYEYMTNSWDEGYDYEESIDESIYEVFPEEVTVTRYVRK